MVRQNSFSFSEEHKNRQLVGLPLSATDKMLLFTLDAITGKDEFCCPSLQSLARFMKCSVSRVRSAIEICEQRRYIEVNRLPFKTSQYRIDWDAIENSESENFNVNQYL